MCDTLRSSQCFSNSLTRSLALNLTSKSGEALLNPTGTHLPLWVQANHLATNQDNSRSMAPVKSSSDNPSKPVSSKSDTSPPCGLTSGLSNHLTTYGISIINRFKNSGNGVMQVANFGSFSKTMDVPSRLDVPMPSWAT